MMPTAPVHQGWAAIQAIDLDAVVLLLRQVLVLEDPVRVAACRACRPGSGDAVGREVGHLAVVAARRCPSFLRYGRYSSTAGTGSLAAPSGSQMRAPGGSRRSSSTNACADDLDRREVVADRRGHAEGDANERRLEYVKRGWRTLPRPDFHESVSTR